MSRKAQVLNLYFIFTSVAAICLIMDSPSPLSRGDRAAGRRPSVLLTKVLCPSGWQVPTGPVGAQQGSLRPRPSAACPYRWAPWPPTPHHPAYLTPSCIQPSQSQLRRKQDSDSALSTSHTMGSRQLLANGPEHWSLGVTGLPTGLPRLRPAWGRSWDFGDTPAPP